MTLESRRKNPAVIVSALVAASAALLLPLSGLHADPAPAGLQPYTARYQVSYRGLSGGEIEQSFHRGREPNQWQYETRVFPNLLARIAVSPQAHETSTMMVTPSGVRPLSYTLDDGSNESEKDIRLAYDWSGGRVTGTASGKPVDLPLTPGTQDTSSVQAAMIEERLAGRKPQTFRIITGNRVHDYRYWSEGTQQVMTPYGQVDAEVWANQRDGSTRVSKVWHAPSLGYVPVQAIQYKKGQPEVQMKLVKLQRDQ
jgi:hypothetical protein